MSVWVCSKCGMAGASPQPGATALDPRYTTGYCECSPMPVRRSSDAPRLGGPIMSLVRADVWDPEILAQRRRIGEFARLDRKKHPTAADTERMADLRRQFEREAAERKALSR